MVHRTDLVYSYSRSSPVALESLISVQNINIFTISNVNINAGEQKLA